MRRPGTGGCALGPRLFAHARCALLLSSMPGALRSGLFPHPPRTLLLSGLPGTLGGDVRRHAPLGPRNRAILASLRAHVPDALENLNVPAACVV